LIGSGPLAGHTGVIESWSGDDRVRLLIQLMNRAVPVTVNAAEISEVSDPAG
jgi:transcription antitermination factor NusG